MIEFDNVSKKYGKGRSLNEVSFMLKPGEIYGLIGPNGSGKSTTLKLIAGLVFPTSGFVKINGEIVDRRISSKVAY